MSKKATGTRIGASGGYGTERSALHDFPAFFLPLGERYFPFLTAAGRM